MISNDPFACVLSRTHASGAGLAGVEKILARLGSPQQKYKIIHVAGTNGKGSVCTLLAHALTCAGHKTGLFVSPHLLRPTERIQLDGVEISVQDFSRVLKKVEAAEEEPLNFFERLTVAALVYFAEQKADYVVLETGLGGRKDPTNGCAPVAAVITSIGLDHMHLLGTTISQIAAEKGGIIKEKIPVFCGPLPAEASDVLTQLAHAKNAPFYEVKRGEIFHTLSYNWEQNTTVLSRANGEQWPLGLLGYSQADNAALVYRVAQFLGISGDVLKRAFATVRVMCRFEILAKGRTHFILDGAHNAQAVENFIALWRLHPAYPHAALIFGAMRDKEYQKMLALLAPHFDEILLTQVENPRVVPAEELAAVCATLNGPRVVVCLTVEEAFLRAQSYAWCGCVGSFYLAAALRARIF